MTDSAAIDRLRSWPRSPIADLPTPLHRAHRLAERLGLQHLYVKMDAETGFALGGNKVRKLEFELAPHRLEGITCLITAGGVQSNHCRVTAAFAARHGLRCVLVQQGDQADRPTGNALLHRLFGAKIVPVATREDRTPTMSRVCAELEAEGERPMIVPIGASTGLGSLGYALATLELLEQLDATGDGCERTVLFVSASSCGTLAGLWLGTALARRSDLRLVGVSADASADELRDMTVALAREGAGLLQLESDLDPGLLATTDSQVGAGYAAPTPEAAAATELFARSEGVVLDPTYSAKAAAGLIEWVEGNEVEPGTRIVFLHTGGAPGLLA